MNLDWNMAWIILINGPTNQVAQQEISNGITTSPQHLIKKFTML